MTTRKTKSGKIVTVREPKDLIRYSYTGLSRLALLRIREEILSQDTTKNIIVNPEKVSIHLEIIDQMIAELTMAA